MQIFPRAELEALSLYSSNKTLRQSGTTSPSQTMPTDEKVELRENLAWDFLNPTSIKQ